MMESGLPKAVVDKRPNYNLRRAVALGMVVVAGFAGAKTANLLADISHQNELVQKLEHPIGYVKLEVDQGKVSAKDAVEIEVAQRQHAWNEAEQIADVPSDTPELSNIIAEQQTDMVEKGDHVIVPRDLVSEQAYQAGTDPVSDPDARHYTNVPGIKGSEPVPTHAQQNNEYNPG
jgi:hypothetical protein